MQKRTKLILGGSLATAAILASTVGGATAGSLITSHQIKDGAVHKVDLSKGVQAKLNKVGTNGVNGTNGVDGKNGNDGAKGDKGDQGIPGTAAEQGAKGDQGDKGDKGDTGRSAYQSWLNNHHDGTEEEFLDSLKGHKGDKGDAGLANVTTGAGYSHTWAPNGELNTIVSKCSPGQVALGGGFSTWGGSDANESGLPYDMGGDNKSIQITVSAPYTGEAYDENKYGGDIRPDRWVVKGYNNGDTDQIVRAWVICADVPA